MYQYNYSYFSDNVTLSIYKNCGTLTALCKIISNRLRILPRVLRNVSSIDMSTSILGEKIEVPFCIAPTAMHKLAHPEGELATARGWYKLNKVVRAVCTAHLKTRTMHLLVSTDMQRKSIAGNKGRGGGGGGGFSAIHRSCLHIGSGQSDCVKS
jgi:hypothetical protein